MFITILVYHSKTPDTTLLAQVGPQQKLASFWRDILGQRIFPVGGGVIKNIVLSLHHGTYKTTSRDPTGRTNRQL